MTPVNTCKDSSSYSQILSHGIHHRNGYRNENPHLGSAQARREESFSPPSLILHSRRAGRIAVAIVITSLCRFCHLSPESQYIQKERSSKKPIRTICVNGRSNEQGIKRTDKTFGFSRITQSPEDRDGKNSGRAGVRSEFRTVKNIIDLLFCSRHISNESIPAPRVGKFPLKRNE